LQYDDLRRASLLDGLWDDGEVLDPVAPWSDARFVLGRIPMAATVMAARVDRISGAVTVDLVPAAESSPLRVEKRLVIEGGSVEARYRLTSRGGVVGGRWGVQWNLAVTAGEGRERYLDVPGRPAPRSVGRETAELRPVPPPTFPRPRLVVVAGMGGSASSGDLLAGCAAERLDVPVIVHRGYGLPTLAGNRDLVIATSYSGDTAESLSAAEA